MLKLFFNEFVMYFIRHEMRFAVPLFHYPSVSSNMAGKSRNPLEVYSWENDGAIAVGPLVI